MTLPHVRRAARSPLVVLALAALTGPAWGAERTASLSHPQGRQERRPERREDEHTERISRTLQADPSGELEMSIMAGDVVVSGSEGREIRIEATKRVRERDETEAKRQLALVEMEIVQRGARVEIRTQNTRGRRGVIDYVVTIPSTMRVTLKSISGDLSVSNVKGDVSVEAVSGDVRVAAVPRLSVARSVSGEVDLSDIAAAGEMMLGSVSGSVMVRGLEARGLELETVSGDLTLTNVTCERVNLRTVSGDLTYTGPLAKNGRYEFTLHSGDALLTFTNQTGFDLKASSFSGDIQTGLPITLRPTTGTDRRDDRGRERNRAISGVYGDGSALLEISTFSGDVTINQGR